MEDEAGGIKPSKMEPGSWVRAWLEERRIKPSDVERITRAIADTKHNADFYVSHSTLADIEAGSIPSIHKLFSLAICFGVSMNELLLPFGIEPEEAATYEARPALDVFTLPALLPRESSSRFHTYFDAPQETTLLRSQHRAVEKLAPSSQAPIDLVRHRYAVIGSEDNGMADLLPPRSLVEIDTAQNTVQAFAWQALRDRPIYLVWHSGGHTCRWCQVDGKELTLVPHPLSQQPVQRFKMPREAIVIGRVTNAWLTFESVQLQRKAAS
jgi:transcriptional regulator with XRE-family HTH domain